MNYSLFDFFVIPFEFEFVVVCEGFEDVNEAGVGKGVLFFFFLTKWKFLLIFGKILLQGSKKTKTKVFL